MIDPAVLRAMLNAGCTADQIVAVAEEAARADEGKRAEKRAKDAERQRRSRSRHAESTMSRVTERDGADNLSPKERSPIPPKEITPIPVSEPIGSSTEPRAFDQFWSIYPNRVGKRDAEKAFVKALKRSGLEAILAGLRRYAAKTDDRPWCNPATWLNQDRWEDAPADVPQRQGAGPPKKITHANMWTEEAISLGIIDEPASQTTRHLDARLARGQDQSLDFSRRAASA